MLATKVEGIEVYVVEFGDFSVSICILSDCAVRGTMCLNPIKVSHSATDQSITPGTNSNLLNLNSGYSCLVEVKNNGRWSCDCYFIFTYDLNKNSKTSMRRAGVEVLFSDQTRTNHGNHQLSSKDSSLGRRNLQFP